MWLKRALLVLSTVAGVLAIPGTSFADAYAPTVDSVGPVTSETLTAGSVLTVPFTASDQGGSGVASVTAIFTNPRASDHIQTWILARWNGVPSSSVSSTLQAVLGPWVASGTWTLARVDIADEQNNQRTYTPTGISTIPDDGTSPPNNIDWSQSLTVDNPNEDVTKPHLTSLHVFEPTIAAGEPLVVLYTATDENSGVAGVWFEYTSPRGTNVEVYNNDPVTAAIGPAVWLAPLSAYGGDYTLSYIYVQDRAGNTRRYGANGDPDSVNDVNLSDGNFSVTPIAEDATVPSLDSLTAVTPTTRHPGDEVAMDFTAHDDATGVTAVAAWWQDTESHGYLMEDNCDLGGATSGRLSMSLPSYAALGTWNLERVGVRDGQGNWAYYMRDGTIAHDPTSASASGPDSHTVDLPSYDFTVSAGDPSPPVTSPPPVSCSFDPEIALSAPSGPAVAGSTITVGGAVSRDGNTVDQPVVATYSSDSNGVHLLGVTRGGHDGTFAQAVAPTASMHYWAKFFGKARGTLAEPGTSAQQILRVVHPVTIGVARTSDGRLLREAAGVPVHRLGGSTRSAPAVVGHGTVNYYFEITNGTVRVRDDVRGWRTFGRPLNGCAGVAAAVVRSSVRIACVGADHVLRMASAALGTALPTASTWHRLGAGATTGPSLWVTNDGTVHALIRSSTGRLRSWTASSGWNTLPMTCSGRPAATAAGSALYIACARADGKVRVWKHAGGSWSSRLIDAHAAGAPALSSRLGVVQLWVTTRTGRLATRPLNTSATTWTRWADLVTTGVAAGAGVA